MLENFNKSVHSTEAGRAKYRFSFKVLTEQDLRVSLVDPGDGEQVPLFLGADYQVSGVDDDNGGQIDLTVQGIGKAENGLKIVLKRGKAYEGAGGGGTPFPGNFDISYEEQWTGFYDRTDGDRKIYVKTVDYGWLSTACTSANPFLKRVPHGIVGLRTVYHVSAMLITSGGFAPLPQPSIFNASASFNIGVFPQEISISNGVDRSATHKAMVIIVYTKDE